MTDLEVSLYEERMSTPAGKASLAAAEAAAQVMNLLDVAKADSGMTQKQLGQTLGITEGRVSQVMSGDGNFHIATVARFLDAMGAKLTLGAVTANGRVLRRARRGAPRGKARLFRTPVVFQWATEDGVITSEAEIVHLQRFEMLGVSTVPPSWHTNANPGAYQRNVEAAVDAETRTVAAP
jgi:DNA-binding phage protein